MTAPLQAPVVCAPLAVEHAALRPRLPGVDVVRTGYGPRRSTASAAAIGLLPRPALVAGLAGGLDDALAAGDLLVPTELRSSGPTIGIPTAPLLAGALRRCGLRVHARPLHTSGSVVHGERRTALAATGALGVDMESAALYAAAGGGPFAVVRAIVDTPSAPLARPGTVVRGVRGLRALRAAAPAIQEWIAATGARELVLASPRSFCAGVERAIEIVERSLLRYGAPVYVRRQVVHNAHVVRGLERRGAVFVDEVEQIPPGSVTVLAAHGVAPSVRTSAAQRSLSVIDATCPLVSKVHSEARRYAARGNTVLLIGHADHEEVVGTVGEAPDNVRVVADVSEAESVQVPDPDRVAYVMQTTLAVNDAAAVLDTLTTRFPALRHPRSEDICYATTNRQAAVRAVAAATDVVLVVGSANSSNSLRLVEVAERAGTPAHLVEDATEVDLRWLAGADRIGITAGASAPPALVDDLVHCLSGLGPTTVRTTEVAAETIRFTLPREVS